MSYEFKKLSDVEAVETPADTANVLIEEDGVIKKAPKTAVGGGDYDLIFEANKYMFSSSGQTNISLVEGDAAATWQKSKNCEVCRALLRQRGQYDEDDGAYYDIECTVYRSYDDLFINGIVPENQAYTGFTITLSKTGEITNLALKIFS